MSDPRESPFIWNCPSEAATNVCAAEIAGRLKTGDIILLGGDLGAGKTSFARALIRTLTGKPDLNVPSPTFTLVQIYDTPIAPVWHFDLYRLKDPEEIYELGWDDALAGGLLLIEWPDKLEYLKPAKTINIDLQPVAGNPDARTITLTDLRS